MEDKYTVRLDNVVCFDIKNGSGCIVQKDVMEKAIADFTKRGCGLGTLAHLDISEQEQPLPLSRADYAVENMHVDDLGYVVADIKPIGKQNAEILKAIMQGHPEFVSFNVRGFCHKETDKILKKNCKIGEVQGESEQEVCGDCCGECHTKQGGKDESEPQQGIGSQECGAPEQEYEYVERCVIDQITAIDVTYNPHNEKK